MTNIFLEFDNLSEADVRDLIRVCVDFDAKNILGPEYEDVVSDNIPRLGLSWKSKTDFEIYIKSITDTRSIAEANKKLEKKLLSLLSSEKERPLDPNMPDKWAREEMARKQKSQNTEIKDRKTRDNAKENVSKTIERKREIIQEQQLQKIKKEFEKRIEKQKEVQTKLDGKKVYAKVIPPQPEEANDYTKQLIERVKKDPPKERENLSSEIEEYISKSEISEKMSKEEIKNLADKVSNDTINAIVKPVNQVENTYQTAILNSLSKDSVVSKTIDDKSVQDFFDGATKEMSFFNNQTALSRNILSSFNKNLASNVFGPDPQKIDVLFFAKPEIGFTHTIDLQQLNSGYGNFLDTQSQLFDKIGSFGQNELKGFLMGQTRTFLDSQIAKLSTDSVLSGVYNSPFGQQILNFAGLTEYVPLGSSPFISFAQQIPGTAPMFEWIGNTLGIDFAMGAAAPAAEIAGGAITAAETSALTTSATTATAGIVATEVGTGLATGTAAGVGAVGAGAVTGIVATGGFLAPIILAGTAIVTAIGKLIHWDKIKAFLKKNGGIIGVALITGGSLFTSLPMVVIGGIFLLSGIGSSGRVVALIAGLLIVIGKLIKSLTFDVGKTIVTTIITVPIAVALILLVINSGAYVTPPNASVGGYYGEHDCSKGIKIIERAKEINSKLQLGFNDYYNKSPDYPELWNAELFAINPAPQVQTLVIGSEDMFWCNYTPVKSYLAINEKIPFGLTAMMNYFISQNKWTSGEMATPKDICPGDTIFFKSPAGASILSHVAVVYSVSEDEIITVQSNSPWLGNDYPVDSSGHFPIYGKGDYSVKIVGFGAP